MLNLVLIGAGNLGFNFYREFSISKKINLIQWYNRKLRVIKFAKKNTSIIDDLKNLKEADIYIVCIKDDSIKKIIQKINLKLVSVEHFRWKGDRDHMLGVNITK